MFGHADVINLSFGFSPACQEDSGFEMQDEVENAFDDGALVVASVGNVAGPSSNCNIQQPSSTIKALGVNAFDAVDPASCQTNYHQWCLVDHANSAKGGITANVAGTSRSGALTGVGLVGPNEVNRYTSNSGDFGDVSEDFLAPGTSYAAPTVAGLALVMKHRMLDYGNTWINSPGRLQTVMLAMGDRHYSINPTSKATSTDQRTTRGDVLYGFGRPTLRKMTGSPETPTGFNMVTWNTRTSTHTYFPFGVLPSGTELVKCVLHQHEDLSGATTSVADFNLRLRVTAPVGGACSSAGVQVGSALEDGSYDVKSMVALEDEVARPLAGNCVEVRILPVAADRVTSTNTFCYYSGIQDDE